MIKLKYFQPTGNGLAVQVIYHNQSVGGVQYTDPKPDIFGKVVAVGSLVEKFKVGDLVMFGAVQLPTFPMVDNNDKVVHVSVGTEFQVIAWYKDKKATRVFVPDDPEEKKEVGEDGISVLGDGQLGEWAQKNEELLN